ncbi:MAG: tetratricopeptide repeat protein [Vicinamibacteria bacterium]|nr:tetratricopeptide repeat protein [Vicinamibacteria bacterium]
MDCPRCGHPNDEAAGECIRCGVVFARAARPPRPRPAPPPAPAPAGSGAAAARIILAIVVVGVTAVVAIRGWRNASAGRPAAGARSAPVTSAAAVDTAPPEGLGAGFDAAPSVEAFDAAPVRGLDADSARDLAHVKALAHRVPSDADLEIAERLLARHGANLPGLQQHVANLYVRAARADHDAHRQARAATRLERAAALIPDRPEPWVALSVVRLDASQWSEAEAAARRAVELDPQNPQATLHLAWALYRQDRNREAAALLDELLAIREDASARGLRERIRKQGRDEAGMAEHRAAHFTLRFEGDEAADIGHEILQALERHRATLVSTLDHEPEAPIAVILFSREAYYDAAGAPRWSGGVFDSIDGRIRIPIGGLDRSLTPDMDETLVHEVTHAFVADLSKTVCPRDVHEGLAQYMEGKRSEEAFGARGLAFLAAGRIPGVQGFYAGALSFVEHLIAERGMGGLRELLVAMGETRSEEAAFEQVYGRGATAQRKAWIERLRQRYPL